MVKYAPTKTEGGEKVYLLVTLGIFGLTLLADTPVSYLSIAIL